MSVAFVAQGLRVALAGREVLHGVDLSLQAGCWTAVVGPNGAGKTTLLRALAHLVPYEGRVSVLGRDAAAWTSRERAKALAWLGQGQEAGAEDLRAWDIVLLGRLPHRAWLGAPNAQDRAAVEQAMRRTQCWDWRARPLGQLSGGERQRVLLARLLAVGAPVLLMDEPLANLDPPHQADVLAIVRAHVAGGGTAVTVLHELSLALRADDLLVVDGGRIAHHGGCSEPDTHEAVSRVFGHRVKVRAVDRHFVALPED
ncbi:ABC transporter ATP-binding protein [Ramlibacter humi]|uniref:ABC transporter ATP-binding protein n=1 Tax=Ramlibacter humi TaxID=2530451 RepID=A0A4Z0CBZ8_9BURK|nr:ABC transporter ATP-binding protein [Ramlibacter humi]TFZ07900.1 ABC transporter ATP-binding protein [Ramlibacter humi]